MRKFFIPFFALSFLSLFISPSQAQNGSDSLYTLVISQPDEGEDWISLTYQYCRAELRPDSSIKYARIGLLRAEDLALENWQLKYHELLARVLLNNRAKLDSADFHLTRGISLYRSVPDSLFYLGSLLRIRGEFFRQMGDFEQSLESIEQAFTVLERGLEGDITAEEAQALRYKQILTLNAKGNVLKNQGDCPGSIAVQQQVYDLAELEGNIEQMGYATFNQGGCYFILGDFPRALDAYLSSLSYLQDSASQQSMVANASLAIGAIFAETGELDSARTYFKRALKVGSDFQRTRTTIGTYENLGGLEMLAGRYDSAKHYFRQAISLARTGERWPMLVSNLTQLGSSHLKAGELDSASVALFESRRLAIEKGIKSEEVYSSITLGELFLELNQPRRVLQLIAEAERFEANYPTADLKRRIFLTKSKALEQLGSYKEALSLYRQYVILEDSMKNESQVREITQLNMQHEFDKERSQTQAIQEQKDLLVSERLQRQAIQRNSLLGILLVLMILGFILWRSYQQKRKTNAILESKNQVIQQSLEEKETLLREIHHRVKNNLQVISSLLSIQSRHVKDESIQDAIEEGRNRVRSMAMIHENLYQSDHLTGIDVSSYVENLAHSLFESYNTNLGTISLETDISPLSLDVDTVIPLGLILNELITNSLKYAFPGAQQGQISISLKEEDENLRLTVEDDGVGLPQGVDLEQSKTMGYKLIRAFLAKLKGTIEISSIQGTRVSLNITQYRRA